MTLFWNWLNPRGITLRSREANAEPVSSNSRQSPDSNVSLKKIVEPLVTVTGLDHIGLRVRDVESSLLFYTGVLGLESERVKEWRNGQVTFPSIRLNSSTLIDLFAAPTFENLRKSIRTISAWKLNPSIWTPENKVHEIGNRYPRRTRNPLGGTRRWHLFVYL
ncbi:MAG: hypothetical protein CM1200mP18_02980 [Gammaproteobacteria bacterium]|nr:MAG: hypothetical protein CM1200mP18_02980 [Gammaproteobacteria bacterium]